MRPARRLPNSRAGHPGPFKLIQENAMPSRQTSTDTTARPRKRSSATARTEVITTLKDDHKRVKRLFREFEKPAVKANRQSVAALVGEACAALEMHTTLEEEIFYPAARECLPDADLIDEAEIEHASAKELIAQLEAMTPDDPRYAATFKVLGEYVKHHIQEEETEMFPQMAKRDCDWVELQRKMTERRSVLENDRVLQRAGNS
jgi:hypothetical protein